MADATLDEKLRRMADHRGLKLVKSRKRKAGTGDYGKFGLTDAAGKALLGIAETGLTASPEDVEDYLRAGSADTWKASAAVTPSRPANVEPRKPPESVRDEEERAIAPRPRRARQTIAEPTANDASTADDVPSRTERQRRHSTRRPEPTTRPEKRVTTTAPARQATPPPEPAPRLVVRPSKSADTPALARLLGQLSKIDIGEPAIGRNLAAARKAGAGMIVATLGDLVGCCGWAVIPTIQHGRIGRLTVLLVADDHRRRGIATALLGAATIALRNAGCARVEAMSEIDIKNSHGFFRALKFEQTSYRYARAIEVASE